jgi:hypothetical protein
MIRIDFPGYSGAESLEPIDWNEWFDKFQERNLALLVQDETDRGERSNFNKLVNRDTVEGEPAILRQCTATDRVNVEKTALSHQARFSESPRRRE